MSSSILAPVAALTLPDPAMLAGRAQQALDFIEGFSVDSAGAFELAGDELGAIKRKQKDLEAQRTAITGPMNDALKAVNNLFRGPSILLDRGESALKTKMLTFQRDEQRKADEQRRQAEAAAAAERQRLAVEAADRQRQADEAARAAAAARDAGDAQAAELATARAHRAAAEAQAAETSAQLVIAPAPTTAMPKAAGVSTVTRIAFEVDSLEKLVAHVAAHPELLPMLQVDGVRLRAYVRGLGLSCKLPGVRVFEESGMAARAA